MMTKRFTIKNGVPYKVDVYNDKKLLVGSKTVTDLSTRPGLRDVAREILLENNLNLSNLGYITVFNLGGKTSIQWASYNPQLRRI